MTALDGQASCVKIRFCLSLLVFEIPILHMGKCRASYVEASIGSLVRLACTHGGRGHVPASTLVCFVTIVERQKLGLYHDSNWLFC